MVMKAYNEHVFCYYTVCNGGHECVYSKKWRLCITSVWLGCEGGFALEHEGFGVHVWGSLRGGGCLSGFEWNPLKPSTCVCVCVSPGQNSVWICACVHLHTLAAHMPFSLNRCSDKRTCKWLLSSAPCGTQAINSMRQRPLDVNVLWLWCHRILLQRVTAANQIRAGTGSPMRDAAFTLYVLKRN